MVVSKADNDTCYSTQGKNRTLDPLISALPVALRQGHLTILNKLSTESGPGQLWCLIQSYLTKKQEREVARGRGLGTMSNDHCEVSYWLPVDTIIYVQACHTKCGGPTSIGLFIIGVYTPLTWSGELQLCDCTAL